MDVCVCSRGERKYRVYVYLVARGRRVDSGRRHANFGFPRLLKTIWTAPTRDPDEDSSTNTGISLQG